MRGGEPVRHYHGGIRFVLVEVLGDVYAAVYVVIAALDPMHVIVVTVRRVQAALLVARVGDRGRVGDVGRRDDGRRLDFPAPAYGKRRASMVAAMTTVKKAADILFFMCSSPALYLSLTILSQTARKNNRFYLN